MIPNLLLLGLLAITTLANVQAPMQLGLLPGSNISGTAPEEAPHVPLGPVTAPCSEVQNIRVNIHFLQHDDGTGNFGAFDDGRPGRPSTTLTGYSYAQNLMWTMNGNMDQNPVLNLAPGSALTPLAKRIRWVLDGVFFDKNTTYRNGASHGSSPSRDYEPLCVRADSVINIFLVEELEWPYPGPVGNTTNTNQRMVTSPLGRRGYVFNQADCSTSPAPGKLWAVVASPWTNYILFNSQPWEIASTINHELCHLLGLNHPFQYGAFSWGECPDAPQNANCWNINPNDPNCATQAQASNNLMDYNTWQTALAPCQIAIMQNNLNTCLKSRYVYKCSNCLPPAATFEVSVGAGYMPVPIWLDSRAAVNYDWYKLEIDELNASGGKVGSTHYETIVYQQLLGRIPLDAAYPFAAGSTYRVQLTTHGYCGLAAVRVRMLTTPPCAQLPGQARRTVAPISGAPTPVAPSSLSPLSPR